LKDVAMATAKTGEWYNDEKRKHYSLANISVAYDGKPEFDDFVEEWQNLISSGSGERGIFNREAAYNQVASLGRRDPNYVWGTNPCSEIILRPNQFCNLSTVIVREHDTYESLARKVRLATIMGTMQASLTHFPYLRDIWKKNTEDEALLGVSMTGQMGNKLLSGQMGLHALRQVLENLKAVAVQTNQAWAPMFGINPAAAVTCVKPEGTTSSLAHTSSGMHAWHSPYYVRTVRGDKKDPLTQMMIEAGVPWENDINNKEGVVFSFPLAAPKGAITRSDLTAIEHLELWLAYQEAWCEHKPSITVSVKDDEWGDVGQWVWEHFDRISGIAFLPYDDHVYEQAPFQDIDSEEFYERAMQMPTIDWPKKLRQYEFEDTTTNQGTLACSAGACDIVDILAQEPVEV
jgi:ribonucleoside-triphosphate reductase